MDNFNVVLMTIKSKLEKLKEDVLLIVRNFQVPGPIFAPIPICKISMSDYTKLFIDSDKRCGAKLYYANGILYLIDTLSYLHGMILGLIWDSLLIDNLYLRQYFSRTSYSKKYFNLFFSSLF